MKKDEYFLKYGQTKETKELRKLRGTYDDYEEYATKAIAKKGLGMGTLTRHITLAKSIEITKKKRGKQQRKRQ